MAATFSEHEDHVAVRIRGKLGVGIWETLRAACAAARAASLPLRFHVEDCIGVDFGGVGVVRTAQQRLPTVQFFGCSDRLLEQFEVFGICGQCASHQVSAAAACPKSGRQESEEGCRPS